MQVVVDVAGNCHEGAFTDPHRFDNGRCPNRHLALGIGATLARTQMMKVLIREFAS